MTMMTTQARAGSSSEPAWSEARWVLALALLALLWDALGLDVPVMGLIGSAQGFAWQHQFVLERVLHDAARHVMTVVVLILAVSVWRPFGPLQRLSRWERAEIVSGVLLCLWLINQIKRNSLTSCPWDLAQFGGVAHYVSHWQWGVPDGGSGRCFPGGHASAALALMPLAGPWRRHADAQLRLWGQRTLWAVLGLGLLFGLVQTLRGAHYPSHTAWTVVLCASMAWMNAQLWRAWHNRRARRVSITD